MPDRAMELHHLAQADRHISEGEQRVLVMQGAIARAAVLNMNANPARALLALIVDGLAIYKTHRQMILETIESIDRRGGLRPLKQADDSQRNAPGSKTRGGPVALVWLG